MARYDDLNTGAIAYATFVSTILFVIIVLLTRALSCYWLEEQEAARVAGAHYSKADATIAAQKDMANRSEDYEVEVAGEGENAEPKLEKRTRIPIGQAKEILFNELKQSGGEDA